MTREEALGKAVAAGIPPDACTPAVLALFGYTPPDPLGGAVYAPVQAPDEVTASLQTLDEEARANRIPARILDNVATVIGWAKKVGALGLLIAVLVLPGCFVHRAATDVTVQTGVAVAALDAQHRDLEDRLLADYRAREQARVDDLYEAAVQSATQRVPIGGVEVSVINPGTARALFQQRLALYGQIEDRIAAVRVQQANVSKNAANAARYLSGLRAYFDNQTKLAESWAAAAEQFKVLVDKIGGKTTGAGAASGP